MCKFYEAVVSERETKGQRYANACAVVIFPFDYMHACMHILQLSRKLISPGSKVTVDSKITVANSSLLYIDYWFPALVCLAEIIRELNG